jgi:hypothetical protein
MKRTIQYVRMASQRRLFSFALSQEYARSIQEEELADPAPEFDHSHHLVVIEGHVLRRRITDAEYDDF